MVSLNGLQVLIVEDEYLFALALKDAVADAGGISIGPVATWQQGKVLADRQPLGGALLDVNLGDELVFPLACVLRERSVPFIFLSGGCRTDVPAALKGAAWLAKPVPHARSKTPCTRRSWEPPDASAPVMWACDGMSGRLAILTRPSSSRSSRRQN